jgi:hypothetical protein
VSGGCRGKWGTGRFWCERGGVEVEDESDKAVPPIRGRGRREGVTVRV